ncbi:hypothetical protein QW180_05745 [Vibrio sinaloensis]|nr:hypothetical protein [Vibrio sinaloensis]
MVIDVDELPSALMLLASPILALDAATHQYVSFMEAQLEHSVTDEMEENMLGLLFELLSRQCHSSKMDVRIKKTSCNTCIKTSPRIIR